MAQNADKIICEGQVWLMPDGERARVIPGGHHGLWLCEHVGFVSGRFRAFTAEELREGTLVGGPHDARDMEDRARAMAEAMHEAIVRTGREHW